MFPDWQSATGSEITLADGEPAAGVAAPVDAPGAFVGAGVDPLPPHAATMMPSASTVPVTLNGLLTTGSLLFKPVFSRVTFDGLRQRRIRALLTVR